MSQAAPEKRWIFPKWLNSLRPLLGVGLLAGPVYLVVLATFGLSAKTINTGYAPIQPVPYSHALHVGQLGMDCRYCHNTVETASHAAIPPTETCMNCHNHIRTQSEKLAPVRNSHATGRPIPWVKVHDLPDYVYFNHGAHVRAGGSCVSCHGRVDKMDVVQTVSPLNMSWCLACHENPDPHIRPRDKVTQLDWVADDPVALGRELRDQYNVNPRVDCWTCHR
ncbi:MAG: cytochrome c3 family protein [Acidobacteriota bacterium]|nr:MAG: cytochrome c3 family protein [Acidobacteriota bacterium]